MPDLRPTMRARFGSSLRATPLPSMTSPNSALSTPAFAMTSWATGTASWLANRSLNIPPNLPMAVLAPDKITISLGFSIVLLSFQ